MADCRTKGEDPKTAWKLVSGKAKVLFECKGAAFPSGDGESIGNQDSIHQGAGAGNHLPKLAQSKKKRGLRIASWMPWGRP